MREWTTRRGHRRWLLVTGLVIGAFGPVFALASAAGWAGPGEWTLEVLNGPGGRDEEFDGTTRFLTALTGGFLTGWGVMVLALRHWAYDLAPEPVRRSVLVGLLAWFVVDSPGSIASGTAWNALFNVAVLLLAVGPLWRPAADGG